MLQKLGWSEGQGLGSEGSGRIEPVNKYVSYTIWIIISYVLSCNNI